MRSPRRSTPPTPSSSPPERARAAARPARRRWTAAARSSSTDAAKAKGIDRYLIVSSIGADPDAKGDGFAAYLRAKGQADAAVRDSGLAFTIVRPTQAHDDPGTGSVEIGEGLSRSEIPRDDVAAVLVAALDTPRSAGKTFDLTSGDTPIDEAVAAG